jgi:hypothetical protein
MSHNKQNNYEKISTLHWYYTNNNIYFNYGIINCEFNNKWNCTMREVAEY